eukprot:TRINITY_DN1935_c0_g1_i2.p1 TRINITY_DN1935_c0_g1~~TRINITY_DN1935_c0_g1_i2.p1  ORF type:complete len:917 (+),score=231.83 TRINITY_DN1935_c0_g1_i2:237-2987(+)
MSVESEYYSNQYDDGAEYAVYEESEVNPFAVEQDDLYDYESSGDGLASIEETNQTDEHEGVLPASLRKHFAEVKEYSESLRQQCVQAAFQMDIKETDAGFQTLQQKVQLLEDEVIKLFSHMRRTLAEGDEDMEDYENEDERNSSKALYVCEDTVASSTPGTPTQSSTSFRKEIAKRLEKRGIRLFSAKVTKVEREKTIRESPSPKAKSTDYNSPDNLEKIVKLQKLAKKNLYMKRWRKLVDQYRHSEKSIKSRRRFEKEKEILSSERSYVSNIQIIVSKFLNPLNKSLQMGYTDITQDNVNSIFSNINVILSVNTTFLKELEAQYSQYPLVPLQFGAVFLRMIPFFKTYTMYVNSYENALSALGFCRAKKSFTAWLKKAEASAGKHDIGSYLIMPVQRIMRYEMLLADLISLTEEGHIDYPNLCQALQKTKEVAEYINQQKKKAENLERVLEIQKSMTGLGGKCLVGRNRVFVKEGILKVGFSDGYSLGQKRAILFSDSLVLADYSNYKKKYQFRGAIALREAAVEDAIGKSYKNAFKLIYRKELQLKEVILYCADEEDKATWMRDISRLIADVVDITENKIQHLKDATGSYNKRAIYTSQSEHQPLSSSHSSLPITKPLEQKSDSLHILSGTLGRRKRYWFTLRNNGVLSYYNQADASSAPSDTPVASYDLREFELRRQVGGSKHIQLYHQKKSMEIAFPTEEACEEWIKALKPYSKNGRSSPTQPQPRPLSLPPTSSSNIVMPSPTASTPKMISQSAPKVTLIKRPHVGQPLQSQQSSPQLQLQLQLPPPPREDTVLPVAHKQISPRQEQQQPLTQVLPKASAQQPLPQVLPKASPQQPPQQSPRQSPPPKMPPPAIPTQQQQQQQQQPLLYPERPTPPAPKRERASTLPGRPLPSPPAPTKYDICAPMRTELK